MRLSYSRGRVVRDAVRADGFCEGEDAVTKVSRRATRIKACELAATVLGNDASERPYVPRLWSLCVFFESYIDKGADGTLKDFGPRKPTKLKVVRVKT